MTTKPGEEWGEMIMRLGRERREASETKLLPSHPQAASESRPTPRLIHTPADAESSAAEFMRKLGFADAKRTSSGADGGIDVIAAGAVAQVKTHMKPIGRPHLQQFHGAARGRKAFFFSLQGYGKAAQQWGDSVGMALFGFDLEGRFFPVNRHAKEALSASEAERTPQLGQAQVAAWTPRTETSEQEMAAKLAALQVESLESRVKIRHALGQAEVAARKQISNLTSKIAGLSNRRDYLIEQRERLLAEEADPQPVSTDVSESQSLGRPSSVAYGPQFMAKLRDQAARRAEIQRVGPSPVDAEDAGAVLLI